MGGLRSLFQSQPPERLVIECGECGVLYDTAAEDPPMDTPSFYAALARAVVRNHLTATGHTTPRITLHTRSEPLQTIDCTVTVE